MIAYITLITLGAIALGLFIPFNLVSFYIRNDNYVAANNITSKFKLLIDNGGYFTQEFVAYIALRAKDIDQAKKMIDNFKSDVPKYVVIYLRLSLFALQNQWQDVDIQFNAFTANLTADKIEIESLPKLRTAIQNKNVDDILNYMKIGSFGKVSE